MYSKLNTNTLTQYQQPTCTHNQQATCTHNQQTTCIHNQQATCDHVHNQQATVHASTEPTLWTPYLLALWTCQNTWTTHQGASGSSRQRFQRVFVHDWGRLSCIQTLQTSQSCPHLHVNGKTGEYKQKGKCE